MTSPISPATLKAAVAALKAQIAPIQARESNLQADWSRAAGRVRGVRADHAAAARIADLRAAVAGELAVLNCARVEIEDALERGSW